MTLDLGFLRPLYEHEGPFASVVLETERAGEDAWQAIPLRWRALREQLESLGTDDATLAALDEVVGTQSGIGGEQGQLVVAADGRVMLDERLFRHPGQGVARWERLPYPMPLLRDLADRTPCLVVQIDNAGADIEVRGPNGDSEQVSGSDHPLHKVRGGGWSHRKIQQRAEDNAKNNARLVAERVDELVRSTGIELVVVTGEPKARTNLAGELSGDTRGLVVDVDHGSRHADGQDVDALVADVVEQRAQATAASVVATFREELDRHRNGVAGLDRTVEALRRAQVDTVLVEERGDRDAATEASLWVGADPLAVAHQPEVLETLGVQEKHRVPATSALVRAAACSGAGVLPVPPDATGHRDGIGALLRYVNEPARSDVHA